MSRSMPCAIVALLILMPATSVRADDAEDRAVAFVLNLKGSVTRDETLPGKSAIGVALTGTTLTDAGLKELQLALPKCKINR